MTKNNEIGAELKPCRCECWNGGCCVRETIEEGGMRRPYRTRCVVCGRSGSFEKTPKLADESWKEMMCEPWTPVGEGLPARSCAHDGVVMTESERVLVCGVGAGWVRISYYCHALGVWNSGDVTAWKPLPAPYRAEENEGEESTESIDVEAGE